jgi:hypothetical protein
MRDEEQLDLHDPNQRRLSVNPHKPKKPKTPKLPRTRSLDNFRQIGTGEKSGAESGY